MKNRPIIAFRTIFLSSLFTLITLASFGQDGKTYNVAIYLYEGVELLDFAGPGEVFSSSPDFKVYTVSIDGKELVSQRFVTIKPQYSIETAPSPDIVVFPGGNSGPSAEDKHLQEWIKKKYEGGTFMMSVCTGAGILGSTGMLNGLTVTTFHGYIDGLQASLPTAKVLRETRFVDNGNIITTAGVSAGIDGALHLVSRIRGEDIAKATAHYMEYDKWKPAEGRVEVEHEYITRLRKEAESIEKNVASTSALSASLPYEGELKNLAGEFVSKGSFKAAGYVLERTIKLYPQSASSYSALATLNKKLGKPAPMEEATFAAMIKEGKVTQALALLEKDQKTFPGWPIVRENTMNDLAYIVMNNKKDLPNAIKMFEANVKAYPKSGNVFDSLGEAYMISGSKTEAIKNYKKSIELDPGNHNAMEMLQKLQANNN